MTRMEGGSIRSQQDQEQKQHQKQQHLNQREQEATMCSSSSPTATERQQRRTSFDAAMTHEGAPTSHLETAHGSSHSSYPDAADMGTPSSLLRQYLQTIHHNNNSNNNENDPIIVVDNAHLLVPLVHEEIVQFNRCNHDVRAAAGDSISSTKFNSSTNGSSMMFHDSFQSVGSVSTVARSEYEISSKQSPGIMVIGGKTAGSLVSPNGVWQSITDSPSAKVAAKPRSFLLQRSSSDRALQPPAGTTARKSKFSHLCRWKGEEDETINHKHKSESSMMSVPHRRKSRDDLSLEDSLTDLLLLSDDDDDSYHPPTTTTNHVPSSTRAAARRRNYTNYTTTTTTITSTTRKNRWSEHGSADIQPPPIFPQRVSSSELNAVDRSTIREGEVYRSGQLLPPLPYRRQSSDSALLFQQQQAFLG